MADHKRRLFEAKQAGDFTAIIEVLLSLRVNSLQISPELRKNLVYEIIRNDIFFLTSITKNQHLIDLLQASQGHPQLQHAILSLISVIVSALKGVEYLLMNDQMILVALLQMFQGMDHSSDGSVAHRFLVAILQKMSIKADTIPAMVDLNTIETVISLVKRSLHKETHIFSLDFSTALLANILHAKTTLAYFVRPENSA